MSLHVVPEDLIGHELTEQCVCGPSGQPERRVDGSYGWTITHHALDDPNTTIEEETHAQPPRQAE